MKLILSGLLSSGTEPTKEKKPNIIDKLEVEVGYKSYNYIISFIGGKHLKREACRLRN